MAQAVLPEGDIRDVTILLVAGSANPEFSLATSSDRHEAILSIVEATLAARARIAIPADPELALLAATVGLAYAQPQTAEPAPTFGIAGFSVHETSWRDEVLRRLLVPFAQRNAIRYYDSDGEPVDLGALEMLHGDEPIELPDRQPVTPQLLERLAPLGTVVVAPGGAEREQVDLISRRMDRCAVLVSDAEPELAEHYRGLDPFADDGSQARQIRPDLTDDFTPPPDAVPWPFRIQRLVQGWLETAQ